MFLGRDFSLGTLGLRLIQFRSVSLAGFLLVSEQLVKFGLETGNLRRQTTVVGLNLAECLALFIQGDLAVGQLLLESVAL